jgi:hypothetical protein
MREEIRINTLSTDLDALVEWRKKDKPGATPTDLVGKPIWRRIAVKDAEMVMAGGQPGAQACGV